MTNLPNNHIAVEIPEDATNVLVGGKDNQSVTWKIWPLKFWWDQTALPPGEWILVNTSDSVSEDECKPMVGRVETRVNGELLNTYYEDYNTGDVEFSRARQSFTSLLKSLNLNGRYAILKLNQ